MYIAQVYNILHDWWRYLIGTGVAIMGVFVFSIPHVAAVFAKRMKAEVDLTRLDDVNYIMTLFEPNLNLLFMLLPFAGGLLFLILITKFLHKQSFRHLTTARPKIDWSRFWFAFIFWGIISTGLIFLDQYMDPESYEWNFNLKPFLILCAIGIVLIPLQTSFEEYFFRGYLMQGIGTTSSHRKFPFVIVYVCVVIVSYILINGLFELNAMLSWIYLIGSSLLLLILTNLESLDNLISVNENNSLFKVFNRNSTPLIITSIAFGMLHIANPEIEQLGYILLVYYIGTGFFLGVITLMDDGLELALGFHAANNLFTALLVTADWTAFQTHSIYKDISQPEAAGLIDVFIPVLVVFPIVLFVFAKKYKWSNWSEKLFGDVKQPPKEDYKIIGEIEE